MREVNLYQFGGLFGVLHEYFQCAFYTLLQDLSSLSGEVKSAFLCQGPSLCRLGNQHQSFRLFDSVLKWPIILYKICDPSNRNIAALLSEPEWPRSHQHECRHPFFQTKVQLTWNQHIFDSCQHHPCYALNSQNCRYLSNNQFLSPNHMRIGTHYISETVFWAANQPKLNSVVPTVVLDVNSVITGVETTQLHTSWYDHYYFVKILCLSNRMYRVLYKSSMKLLMQYFISTEPNIIWWWAHSYFRRVLD